MATVTVGTIGGTMTAAQLKTALDNAVGTDLTRQGHANSRTYRCVDNLQIQGDTNAEGFTFICANGKTVTFHGSSASPGVLRTSSYVDGSPFLPIRIVYEGESPFGEHDVTQETQGFFRNCGADIGRLEIVTSGDSTSNYFGLPFLTAQKVVIRELSVSNQSQSGLCYTNFNLTHAQSSIRLACVRNSTIRLSATLDFGFTGDQGWAFGEGGTQDVKLLSPNNSRVIGFAPKFTDSTGVVQLTDPNFNATTRFFRDSFITPSRVYMFPTGNDSAVTEIERTFTYRPQDPSANGLSNVMARVLADRTIVGSPGVSSGATILHTGSVNNGGTQVLRVWKGFNAGPGSGNYQPATKQIDDSAITVTYRRADLQESSVVLSGYQGAANVLSTMAPDTAFTGTVSAAASITGVSFTYTSSSNTVAVDITSAVTGQQIYNYWKHWTSQSAQMGVTLVPLSLVSVANGKLTITGTLTTSAAITSGGNVTSIQATSTITISSGGSIAMTYSDSTGTRITLSGAEGNISSYVILADSNGNYPSTNAGTIQVSSAGAVTGTGTAFTSAMVGGTLVIGSNQYRVTAQTSATALSLANSDGTTYSGGAIAAGTSYVLAYSPIGSSDDLGWVANAASREITVPSGKTFYVYSIVYGYQPKITYISTIQNTILSHVPEPQVNTSLDTTVRDAIVAQISHSLDSSGNVKLTLSSTMADKSPDVALNGLHRFIFVNGNNFAMLSALGKSAAGVQLKADGVKVFTNKFYGTPADTITPASVPDTGIVIPLHFENLTGDSSYKILRKNVNDVPLTGALWVRAEASVGNDTQNAIAAKTQTLVENSTIIAKEATVSAVPAAVWSATLESGFSASRMTRVIAAAVAGKTSQGPAGFTARNLADTQDQVTGQADATGNRTSAGYGS